jgi:DNA-binding transcriptional MerR regulator
VPAGPERSRGTDGGAGRADRIARSSRTEQAAPSGQAGQAGSSPQGRVSLLNIGQVLELLRPDFPSVTIPKIRFLEDKGLIKPERTPAGYRKFCDADVERLRYVLRMQRDHYLPLKVIGEHLDAIDRGLEPPPIEPVVPTVPKVAISADGLPAAESFRRSDQLRLSRKELLKIVEIDEELLAELEAFGLVQPQPTGHYDTDALVIAQAARELADFGLEPRHLRAFKTAADREVGLVDQVVSPVRRSRDATASARAEEAMSEIAALTVRLHATLVKAGLRRL